MVNVTWSINIFDELLKKRRTSFTFKAIYNPYRVMVAIQCCDFKCVILIIRGKTFKCKNIYQKLFNSLSRHHLYIYFTKKLFLKIRDECVTKLSTVQF